MASRPTVARILPERDQVQLTQGLSRNRRLFGDQAATIFAGRRLCWDEVTDHVARVAGALRREGAVAGDRVAILGLNSDAYFIAYYAIAWADCVFVPMNTRWAPAELEFAMRDSGATILIVDSHFVAQGEAFAAQGMKVIAMEEDAAFAFRGIIEDQPAIPDYGRSGDDLAGIFYTGGTTGRSKGVMLSHANLVTNFLLVQSVAPYPADGVFLHAAPMFHLADACALLGLTVVGTTHVMIPGFDAAEAIRAIQEHRITATLLVPTMIAALCDALDREPADVASLVRMSYGASPISVTTLRRAMAAFPNAAFVQLFGQTELSPVATVLTHEDHLSGRLRSAGRPVPCIDLGIVDQDMTPLGEGEVGEIVVRGPIVMQGYWNQPEVTAAVIVNGWLRTGDAGYLDGRGYLHLVDRVKDMIVTGAENVYSAEVENALMSHPAVVQCAVIGVPDDRWGERVHAVLHIREGAAISEADLLKHCEPLIANYKRPKSFDLRREPLPLSPVGKILKTELRRPFWDGRARGIG